MGVIQENKTFF